MLQFKYMRYINWFVRVSIAALLIATVLAASANAESVSVNDIVALKDQYSVANEPGNTNGPEYDRARSLTIKSPLFTNGQHTIYRSSLQTNGDVSLKCGNVQLFAQLMTDQTTWTSIDKSKKPDAVRFGLYLSANNASEIVSDSCPNLIDAVAAGMEGKAKLPEKATKETQDSLNKALYEGAGKSMLASTGDILDKFKNDPATFANWCATSSRGVACSDDKWQEILGICSVQARAQAADAARYSRPAPSEAKLKKSRQELFGSCLSQQLYGNSSKAKAIAQKIYTKNIDPITAAAAGSAAKAAKAKQLLEDLESNLDETTNTGGQEDEKRTCGTEVTGIGWMMCPLLTAATGFADTMWKLFEGLLISQPLSSDPDNHIYQTWSGFRNIANSMLIIAFLVVIYSQITSAGINNYGIKKMLPRIIIMAILINLSYFIVQITLDIANILGSSVLSFMENATDAESIANLDETGWDGLIGMILGGGLAAGVTIGGIAIAASIVSIGPVLIFIALLLLPGLLAFLAGLVGLMFRQALIPVIAILAPIAFVAYLFPNTQSLFDKWKKLFVGIVFLYPLAATYYGGLKLAAATIASDGQWFGMLMAMTILFFGTGFVLYLALKSNAIVGKAMGAVQGVLGKVTNPIEKFGRETQKSMSAEGRARFMANSPGRKGVMGAIGRGMSRFDRGKRDRELRTGLYNAEADQEYRKGILSEPQRLDGLQNTVGGQGYMDKLSEEAVKNAHSFINNITVTDPRTGKERNLTTAEKLEIGINGSVNVNGQDIKANDGFMRRAAIEQTKVGSLDEMERLVNATANMTDPSLRKAAAATVAQSSIAQKAPWLGGKTLAEMEQGTANTDHSLMRSVDEGAINAESLVNANAAVVRRLQQAAINSQQGSRIRNTLIAAEAKISQTPDLNKRVGDGSDHGVAIDSLRSL